MAACVLVKSKRDIIVLFVDGIFEHAYVLLDSNIHNYSIGLLWNLITNLWLKKKIWFSVEGNKISMSLS